MSKRKTQRVDGVEHFDAARLFSGLELPSTITLDTERTGLAVFAPIPLGPSIVLARATVFRDGVMRPYLVTATKLDRPWPGTDRDVTFAVEELKMNEYGRWESVFSWGFFDEVQCYQFLTSRVKVRNRVWDLLGNESWSEWRQGLGVPDGAIEKDAVEV